MKVYRFPREYSRGFCFITVPLKNSKNTAFLSRCLKKAPISLKNRWIIWKF